MSVKFIIKQLMEGKAVRSVLESDSDREYWNYLRNGSDEERAEGAEYFDVSPDAFDEDYDSFFDTGYYEAKKVPQSIVNAVKNYSEKIGKNTNYTAGIVSSPDADLIIVEFKTKDGSRFPWFVRPADVRKFMDSVVEFVETKYDCELEDMDQYYDSVRAIFILNSSSLNESEEILDLEQVKLEINGFIEKNSYHWVTVDSCESETDVNSIYPDVEDCEIGMICKFSLKVDSKDIKDTTLDRFTDHLCEFIKNKFDYKFGYEELNTVKSTGKFELLFIK